MSTATIPSLTTPAGALANGDSLYEIVSGQRVEQPPMSIRATWIASCLHGVLWPLATQRNLGWAVCEGLFILDRAKDLRRRPDVAFVSVERWPLERSLPDTGDWPIAPDLAVEVISPNELFLDVVGKVAEYFSHGVAQVWLVLPGVEQVYLYSSPTQVRILTAQDDLDGGGLIPGFRLPLAELFKKPQPSSPPDTGKGESS